MNYLSASGRYYTYNIGGDKGEEMEWVQWPDEVLQFFATPVTDEFDQAIEQVLLSGETDSVVINYFDKLWNAHEWPPGEDFSEPPGDMLRVPQERAKYAKVLQTLANRPGIAIRENPLYAIISLNPGRRRSIVPKLMPGQKMTFQPGCEGLNGLQSGWSPAEPWGVWSTDKTAIVQVEVQGSHDRDLTMTVEGKALIGQRQKAQTVDIYANKIRVGKLRFKEPSVTSKTARIPAVLAKQGEGRFDLDFRAQHLKSPLQVGLGNDSRTLGLGLVSLRFD